MFESIFLVFGFLLLLVVGYDFFYTTLSGSGAAFLSRIFSALAHKLQLALSKIFGRKIFSLSGMLVNLFVLAIWVLLVWLGLFLVFSSNPEAIVNSNGRMASSVERLYFTGYILSTLGVGNFKPTTPFFELLTSLFSFFGFIFFTTSMTYLVSVSSAVMHKRSLALAIRDLGKNPAEVVKCLLGFDLSFCYTQILALKKMIDRHSVNHQAYPVLHHYNNPDVGSSLNLNIAILDEAVTILLSSHQKPLSKELAPLRKSLSSFLQHIEEKYGISTEKEMLVQIDWACLSLPGDFFSEKLEEDPEVLHRRKVLASLLKGEGLSWHDVYTESVVKVK